MHDHAGEDIGLAHHQHADEACEKRKGRRAAKLTVGLLGSALALPLAVAAAVDTPWWSFFR